MTSNERKSSSRERIKVHSKLHKSKPRQPAIIHNDAHDTATSGDVTTTLMTQQSQGARSAKHITPLKENAIMSSRKERELLSGTNRLSNAVCTNLSGSIKKHNGAAALMTTT